MSYPSSWTGSPRGAVRVIGAAALLALWAVGLTTCDEPLPVDPPQGFERMMLELRGWPDTVLAGESGTLAAALTLEGADVDNAPIRWRSGDTAVIRIDPAAEGETVAYQVRRQGRVEVQAYVDADPPYPDTAASDSVIALLAGVRFMTSDTTVTALGDTLYLWSCGLGVDDWEVHGAGVRWSLPDRAVSGETMPGDSLRAVATAQGVDTVVVTHDECADACADTLVVTVDQLPARVQASTDTLRMASLGAEDTLDAAVADRRGNAIADEPVAWSVAPGDEGVVTVTAGGAVASVANGEARVLATAGEAADTVVALVSQAPADVVVVHGVDTLTAGTTLELHAVADTAHLEAFAYDASGAAVAGAAIEWATSNPGVATVDADGVVTVVANGDAEVTATAGSAIGAAPVHVAQVLAAFDIAEDTVTVARSRTAQLTPAATDSNGYAIASVSIDWSSSDTTVARVDTDGLVTAVDSGTAEMRAASGAFADSVVVHVMGDPVDSVEVTPDTAWIAVGDTARFSAVTLDSAGGVLSGRGVAWASTDTAKATVDPTGLATARDTGTAGIAATSEGVGDTAFVVITVQPVDSIALNPDSLAFDALTDTARIAAAAFDRYGTLLTGRTLTWASADEAVATVDGAGLVTAAGNGSTVVTASADGAADTATVTVQQVPAGVQVTPSELTLTIGSSGRLDAVAVDARGAGMPGEPITWATTDAAVATVDSGLVAAVAIGTAYIRATSGVYADSARVDVVDAGPPVTLEIDTTGVTLDVGATWDFGVIARDSAGNRIPNPTTSWTSLNPAVATVDAGTGVVTGAASGQVVVQADVDTITAYAVLNVVAPTTRPVVSWDTVPGQVDTGLTAITGFAPDDVWAVGHGGAIVHYDGSSWSQATGFTTTGLTDVWGAAPDDIWAVGFSGTIGHYDGTGWSTAASPTGRSLYGIWGSAPDDIWAVGSYGEIWHWDGTQWTAPSSPTSETLNGVRGTSERDVWVVGDNGVILHYDGTDWSTISNPATEDLRRVWGTGPDDVWAVGGSDIDGEEVLHYDGAGWSTVSAPVPGFFHGIYGTGPDELWITGEYGIGSSEDDGYLLAWDGTDLTEPQASYFDARTTGGATFAGVWGTDTSSVWAVGYDNYDWAPVLLRGQRRTQLSTEPRHALAVGYHTVCTLDTAGQAYCLGVNDYGQVGDGTTTYRTSATAVAGSHVFDRIVAGAEHMCGLKSTGEAFCWGRHHRGQLGHGGSADYETTPQPVAGGHRFVSLTAGWYHTCGLTANGVAYCWGLNADGQLGDLTTTDSDVPVAVSTALDFQQLAAGYYHTCGLTPAGELYCWGDNTNGQFGDGSTTASSSPAAAATGVTLARVDADWAHTCGVATDGTGYCWGRNGVGQLGDGTTTDRHSPAQVAGGHAWEEIKAGNAYTCGVTTTGAGYCWGYNDQGQLGDGTFWQRESPNPVQVTSGLAAIDAAGRNGCGLTDTGELYCWGGARGIGEPVSDPTPTTVTGVSGVTGVAIHSDHSCSLAADGTAHCWGANSYGQLGDGSFDASARSVQVGAAVAFHDIAVGSQHSCAIGTDSLAYCWGSNVEGRLGLGSGTGIVFSEDPISVAGGQHFAAITSGRAHTCALTAAGVPYCWGDNTYLQTGYASADSVLTPTQANSMTFTALSAGDDHTCGLTAAGEVYCWGHNSFDQLGATASRTCGPASTPCSNNPLQVVTGIAFDSLSAGGYHTCGVANNRGYCWGRNNYGQVGDGTTSSTATPTLVDGALTLARISAAVYHTCAITDTGAGYCWGRGDGYQLGTGTTSGSTTPVAVSGSHVWSDMAGGDGHGCGATTTGEVYCWGYKAYGQTGTGSMAFLNAPILKMTGVSLPTGSAPSSLTFPLFRSTPAPPPQRLLRSDADAESSVREPEGRY